MAETPGTDPGVGILGNGTLISGSVTGVIGMLTRVVIDGVDVGEIDVTTMNASNLWRTFIRALKDARTITLTLIYERVNRTALAANVGNVNEAWTVTFPDTSTFVSQGFIKHLGDEIPFDDKIMQNVTIRLSGPPTWAAASGS